jgi:(5-formylfuran-3-yl)methyl phosphate synthase
VTKLLVSVRNVSEAHAAIAGGTDIIDVKEPARGSLGMADAETIADIARTVSKDTKESPPVSAALGESREWLAGEHSTAICDSLTYTKLGLAGLASSNDWKRDWMTARGRVEYRSQTAARWIAVAYVDWQSAESPPLQEVIDAAGETDCVGVLFDTYQKDGHSLLDWLTLPELSRLVATIQAAGMLAALAGGLQREHANLLAGIGADVLAIRTAACEDGRNSTVTASAVKNFRAAMDGAESTSAAKPAVHPAG